MGGFGEQRRKDAFWGFWKLDIFYAEIQSHIVYVELM